MTEVLGVIGGSGLYDMAGVQVLEELDIETPYGRPSDAIIRARLDDSDHELLFLPRHGRGHRIPPHAINYRANICAMKLAGATQMLSISATGSMREEIKPGDLVVIDQLIDLTKRRISTFFDAGVVAHVAFAEPICPQLAGALHETAAAVLAEVEQGKRPGLHQGGTYVCMEGPQFSTKAESQVYRSWNVSLIGMTNMPEAKLAREAQLPYATLALATDYDCWHESEEAVDVQAVVKRVQTMAGHAKAVIRRLAASLPDASKSPAFNALEGSIMTMPGAQDRQARARLDWLLGSQS